MRNQAEAEQRVRESFDNVLKRLGGNDTEASLLWADLSGRYNEPHRRYHRLPHIAAMLVGAQNLGIDEPALVLAVLYHDVNYDPARRDNEHQSANLFRQAFTKYAGEALSTRVCDMIEATCSHKATGDVLTDTLLDLDMGILGADWPDYQDYMDGVAEEYLPVFGPEVWRTGRVERFLKPVLAQGRIFLTPDFEPLEAAARRNLGRELALLMA